MTTKRQSARRSYGLFAVWFGCFGCGASARDTPESTCARDAECGPGRECQLLAAPGSEASTARAMVPICPGPPCFGPMSCPTGLSCVVNTLSAGIGCQMYCAAACATAGCAPGYACGANGLCTPLSCAEPNAPACPSTFRCAPAEAAAQPAAAAGSAVMDDASAIARGCVRRRCDEAGGFVCRELWSCDPASSLDGSGCVARPCRETGRCSSDGYMCPSPGGRPPRGPADAHGCIPKTCEEGLSCTTILSGVDIGYCDFDGPFANDSGCAQRPCAEVNGLCLVGRQCDPSSPSADARGCAARPPIGGSGGSVATGGSAGSAGSSGLGSAGTSSAGSSGNEPRGVCVNDG